MGRIDIVNGAVVPGDGEQILEKTSVVIEDGFISEVPSVPYVSYNAYADRVIDAKGGLIIPGIINLHFHGGSTGPFFPYAWRRISDEKLLSALNTHLLQGTTTLLNLDGMALPSEVGFVNKIHPANIVPATLHTPKNLKAGETTAGWGLEERHKKFTAKEAVKEGAVAMGEIGSPATTFGAGEKGRKLGKRISARQANALNLAVEGGKDADIQRAVADMGVNLTVEQAKKLVYETTTMLVDASSDAIRESPEYANSLGIPALVHASIEVRDAVLDVSKKLGPRLVALHVNHTFTIEQALALARELKSNGNFVEIITADPYGARQLHTTPEVEYALFKEGLVDEIATDYIGGYHDAILLTIQKAVENGVITLPEGIKYATSNPAKIVPGVAPQRGMVAPGYIADLCIVDRNDVSKVKTVIIGGRVIVENGAIIGR